MKIHIEIEIDESIVTNTLLGSDDLDKMIRDRASEEASAAFATVLKRMASDQHE